MMTDAQLDSQLEALKARTVLDDVDGFATVQEFKDRFFARAHAAAEVMPQTYEDEEDMFGDNRSWLQRILHPCKPRAPETGLMEEPVAMKSMICCCESRRNSAPASHAFSNALACFAQQPMSPRMPDFPRDAALPEGFNTEEYRAVTETPFVAAARNPLSTFGADVDTAGYTSARRCIMEDDTLPPADAVRTDEFLNYFRYDYKAPADGQALAPHFELGDAPWAAGHKLLLVGIQARDIDKSQLPPSNYVFLVDNSGSMGHVIGIVKEALTILTRQLRPQDRVSLVTYGGDVRVLLEASGDTKAILKAIDELECSGFTPGGEAIQKAYAIAHANFIEGGNNRIVLVTDGDFNVGASSEAALTAMVGKERGAGIYLSVVGAGCGNYKDNRMKMLANKGDGNYIYIDTAAEARRAFTQGLTGQMYTLAHDAKFQLEFNPARVYAYRLLGYELRRMEDSDFRDDAKDSGEIGVGQQVTALFELVMTDAPQKIKEAAVPAAPPLRYTTVQAVGSDELLTFHLRYLPPQKGGEAVETETAVADASAGENLAWAAAVAEFALLLRDSQYKGDATYAKALALAKATLSPETDDDRLGCITMMQRAADLVQRNAKKQGKEK